MERVRRTLANTAEFVICRKFVAARGIAIIRQFTDDYWDLLTEEEQQEIECCCSALDELIREYFPELLEVIRAVSGKLDE